MSNSSARLREGALTWFGPVLGLVTVYLFFVAIGPWKFATIPNLQATARDFLLIAVASLGLTVVMISGGIDLSVGPVAATGGALSAWLLGHGGASGPAAAFGGIAAAGLVGLVNGYLVSRLRITPVVITLGTMLIAAGIGDLIAASAVHPAAGSGRHPVAATWEWPVIAWALVGLLILLEAALRYTVIGRQIRAIGSNEATARLCGVRVDELKMLVYTAGAALAGTAGVMRIYAPAGPGTVALPQVGSLEIVAAVVIGGGSLFGGTGSVVGAIAGAATMAVARNGCALMGMTESARLILAGCIIVAMAALERLRSRHHAGD
jgi:ribose/xylose/arabinose/galactoside ABC-type transport system permease subunit